MPLSQFWRIRFAHLSKNKKLLLANLSAFFAPKTAKPLVSQTLYKAKDFLHSRIFCRLLFYGYCLSSADYFFNMQQSFGLFQEGHWGGEESLENYSKCINFNNFQSSFLPINFPHFCQGKMMAIKRHSHFWILSLKTKAGCLRC